MSDLQRDALRLVEHEKSVMPYLRPIYQALLEQGGLLDLRKKISSLSPDLFCVKKSREAGVRVNKTVEVESKYQVPDLAVLQKNILSQGFILSGEVIQQDEYQDVGHELRALGQDVRTRKVFDNQGKFQKGELKWEGQTGGEILDRPVVEVAVPTEKEVDLATSVMKRQLGIETFAVFVKQRWHYIKNTEHGRMEIELDAFVDERNPEKIKGKVFAQVAMEVSEEDRGMAIGQVKAVANHLGLDKIDNRDYVGIAGVL